MSASLLRGLAALALAIVGCGVTVPLAARPASAAAPTTFSYTGAAEIYDVPAGVTAVKVIVHGASGGGAYSPGTGGSVTAYVRVPAGSGGKMQITVGGAGTSNTTNASTTGGFNGGGDAGGLASGSGSTLVANGGGGASDVRFGACAATTSCVLTDRVVVAGGGGGGLGHNAGSAIVGGSGGQFGQNGVSDYHTSDAVNAPGGLGGTQSAGGAGGAEGTSRGNATAVRTPSGPGTLGEGGAGGACPTNCGPFSVYKKATGAGGGGGFYGGGGGGGAGATSAPPIVASVGFGGPGGGGSSWVDPTLAVGTPEYVTGGTTGNGSVDITPGPVISGTLPDGAVGQSYSATLTATDGTGPYGNWVLDSGSLPSGLTLSASGSVTGTATAAGSSTFTVRVDDASGIPAFKEFTIVVPVAGPTVPAAPTGLAGTPADSAANLTFTPPVDDGGSPITSYQISVDNSTTWTTVTTSTGPGGTRTATMTGLTNGTTYQVRVRAVNDNGNGAPTSNVPVTPATVPDAPTNLATTPGDGTAALTFTVPADGGSAITAYQVSTDNGVTWASLTTAGSGATRTATVSGLSDGTTYQVRVRASNVQGPGAASNAASAALPPALPGEPTGLTATPGNGEADLVFTPPADTGGSPITSYQVSTDNGATWTTVTTAASGGTRTVTVAGLTNGVTYQVKMRAVTIAGAGAASTAAPVTPQAVAPDAPTGLTVTAGTGAADVTFTPPANDGGSALTGYHVSIDDGTSWVALAASAGTGGALTGTVTGLTNGTTYQVKVRAVNVIGGGAATAAVPVTPATAPGAPTGLTTTPHNGGGGLTFTPPLSTGGSAITGYDVSTDNGATWTSLTTAPGTGGTLTGTVSDLTNDATYQVQVRAVNARGPSTGSVAAPVTPAATVPAAPTSLSTTPGNGTAALIFTPPADTGGAIVTSYEVSTDNGTTWTQIATDTGSGGTRTATVSGLLNDVTYEIALRAVNVAGPGPAGNIVPTTPGATIPAAPTGLATTPGNGIGALAFTPVSDTGGSTITGYDVSTDNGATWTSLTTAPGAGGTLTGMVTGLTNTITYPVRVRAVNSVGPGPGSSPAPLTPAPIVPAAPTGLTVTTGNRSADLTFTPPADDGGSTITGYQVSTDNGLTWSTLTTTSIAGTVTATVTGLINDTTYQVTVRAVNLVGAGGPSTAAQATPAATVPAPPTNLSTTPGNGSSTLVFLPPSDTGGSAITGYQVSIDNGTTWAALTATPGPGDTLTASVTGLTNGTTYQVKVRAVNDVGAGAAGSAVPVSPTTAAPAATAPGAPTGLQTTPGNGRAALSFAAPGDDGGSPITGYEVSTDDGSTWTDLTTTASGNSRTATVTGLTNGTTYQVRVRALNTVGHGPSSAAGPVTPAPMPPGAPTGPSAVSGPESLEVTFTPPSTDGGSPVTGYQFSVDAGNTWTTFPTIVNGDGTRGGTVAGLRNGRTYPLQVRAVNSAGPGPAGPAVSSTAGLPNPPRAVTVTAGTSSVEVSWQASADNGVTVIGYTVVAEPGPATCTTTGATTCVLGGVAGTGYTVTVIAFTADDVNSAPSSASDQVTAIAPVVTPTPPATDLTLITDQGDISTVEPGQELTVIGTGFASFSTVVITIYSDPIPLGDVVTDAEGAFSKTVTVPTDLAVGDHTLIAAGVDPAGDTHLLKLGVAVQADAEPGPGNGGSGQPGNDGGTLPTTGVPVLTMLLFGVAVTCTGAGLYRTGGTWRHRRPRS